MAVDRQQIEQFLYREARLMDEHAYDAWLELFTDDALYWVPCEDEDSHPQYRIALYYDNLSRMQERMERLKSGAAHAQEPKSRLLRVVSNIEWEEMDNGDVTVYANFNLTELRRHTQRTLAGRSMYTLRPQNGRLKIALKKVLLLNNAEVIDNLTFLL